LTTIRKVEKETHGERTDVTETVNVHAELPEEVDDGGGGIRKGVPEDEGSEEDGEEFLEEEGDLHLEELAESDMDLRMLGSQYKGTNEWE
jgi:hypothetical protein